MKKVIALSVALGLAACAPKEAPKPAADSTMAAPAPTMSADTGMKADTAKKDSTHAAAPAAH